MIITSCARDIYVSTPCLYHISFSYSIIGDVVHVHSFSHQNSFIAYPRLYHHLIFYDILLIDHAHHFPQVSRTPHFVLYHLLSNFFCWANYIIYFIHYIFVFVIFYVGIVKLFVVLFFYGENSLWIYCILVFFYDVQSLFIFIFFLSIIIIINCNVLNL